MQKKEENIKYKIEEITENWNKKKEFFVIYLEHTELEKVEMYMINAKSNIETREYEMAVESIDTCKFIISHIKEKYEFSLENIF